MNSFEAYQLYLALKAHFNSKYDFHKYQGKVPVRVESLEKRRDKHSFMKLSKMKDPLGYLVANFVRSTNFWIGDPEGDATYVAWQKRQESLTYVMRNEIALLPMDLDSILSVKQGEHPILLQYVLSQRISLETLILMDNILGFFHTWEKISDPIIWPELMKKCVKYRPFINYDRARIRSVMLDHFVPPSKSAA